MSKLLEIFANKRLEVADAKVARHLSELISICRDLPPTLGFKDKLVNSAHPVSLIAEVKAKSPSAGTIRFDMRPADVAMSYSRAGADCLSVLTDRVYFGGAPENIETCKAATGLPVLRKDFLDDPYQVYEARAWGADAILLIVAALAPVQIVELTALAGSIGLDTLVEVHNEEEVEIANRCGCDLVGVNNRDLSTFFTDLSVTERLVPLLEAGHTVSESAIVSNDDVERVRRAGAKSVLVGTTFCASPDVEAKVREVMAWPSE